ncbi:MAG: hypothetical protein JXX28_17210 [Deltaproteobacteria bacterium]|nr:hypothetical protein [Deltaproteobacteria bacterium]
MRPLIGLSLVLALSACRSTVQPPAVTISPMAPTTTQDLTAEAFSGADVPLRYTWTVDGVDAGWELAVVPASMTGRGQVWEVQVVAVDEDRESDPSVASVTIANTAPVASVVLSPQPALSADDLVAVADGTDEDGDAVSFRYRWEVDGTPTAIEGDTVPAAETADGQVWTVTVTPDDGTDLGEPVSASVLVDNHPPEVLTVSLTPEVATEGSTLYASAQGYDPDGDAVIMTLEWLVSGEVVATDVSELDGASFDKHDVVAVRATPSDGYLTGSAMLSEPVLILDSPPAITGVSLSEAVVYERTAIRCLPEGFTDLDGDAPAYKFAWHVGSAVVSESPDLDGASFQRGDLLVCHVTPWDGELDGPTVTSAPVQVLNTPPALAGVTILEGAPVAGVALHAAALGALDDDGDEVAVSFSWSVNGEQVATGDTLSAGLLHRGDAVAVSAVPSDGQDSGPRVQSAQVTVLNSPPTVLATLFPSAPRTDDTLTVMAEGFDADGDPVQLAYSWLVNGAPVPGAAGASLSGASFDRGDTVRAVLTPSDGTDTGPAFTTSAVTVANSTPAVSGVAVSPAVAYEDTVLSCVPSGWSDADGDPASYDFRWEVNGGLAGSAATLTGSAFSRGDEVLCAATPRDDAGAGPAVRSAPIAVRNSLPVLASAELSALAVREADTLTVTTGALTDADGDAVSLSTAWYVNGLAVSAGGAIDGALFSKGDAVYAELTPSDGLGQGIALTTSTATVGNTPPALSGLVLSPSDPHTDDSLSLSYEVVDDDGDPVEVGISWLVDGVPVASELMALDGTLWFDKGQTVLARLTPRDDQDVGAVAETPAVTVLNSVPSAPVVEVQPQSPAEGIEDLVCAVTTPSTDADGDELSYAFSWEVDDAPFSGATSSLWPDDTVTRDHTGADELWRCTAVAEDGEEASPEASDEVSISAFHEITSVGTPVAQRSGLGTYGWWARDPLETLGVGKHWMLSGHSGSTILEYPSLADLTANTNSSSWNVSPQTQGTGATVLGGYLYYPQYGSNTMVKYDLSTHTAVATRTLPDAGHTNTYAYQWGGYSDIDFAVDEQGLWVIYSTAANGGNIVISKLDPTDLSILQTWNTSYTKHAGNAWMISGVLYVTASYSAANTTIAYMFDTRDGSSWNPAIPFKNISYNAMIDYNYADQRLYSWDNGNLNLYTLSLD